MSGYFTIELDTTAPTIEIFAPSYSDRKSNNTIRVVSNEKLSEFQDIYIVDSQGVKHYVIFSFDGDKEFVGNVVFDEYPIGISTIYAQLKDTVNNISNLAVAYISVIFTANSLMLRLSMSDYTISPSINYESMNFIFSDKIKKINISEDKNTLTMEQILMNHSCSERTKETNLSENKNKVNMEEKNNIVRVSDKN